ncbi:MAG: hypothetical protein WBM09_00435 [Gallionella sp.]
MKSASAITNGDRYHRVGAALGVREGLVRMWDFSKVLIQNTQVDKIPSFYFCRHQSRVPPVFN